MNLMPDETFHFCTSLEARRRFACGWHSQQQPNCGLPRERKEKKRKEKTERSGWMRWDVPYELDTIWRQPYRSKLSKVRFFLTVNNRPSNRLMPKNPKRIPKVSPSESSKHLILDMKWPFLIKLMGNEQFQTGFLWFNFSREAPK